MQRHQTGRRARDGVLRVPAAGRDLRQGQQRVYRLLQGPRPDGGNDRRGRLAPHRRHWPVATERYPEGDRPQEAHLQAEPGRVHRAGEDRERVHPQPVRGAGVCARREFEELCGGDRRSGRGGRQGLGRAEPHSGNAECAVQQSGREAAHLQRHDRAGQGGRTQIIRTGQRHLPSPGSVLGAERPADAHVQEPAAADQELLRAPAGRHVQTSGLNVHTYTHIHIRHGLDVCVVRFLLLSVSRVECVCDSMCECVSARLHVVHHLKANI